MHTCCSFRGLRVAHGLGFKFLLRCLDYLVEHLCLYLSHLLLQLILYQFVEFSQRFAQPWEVMIFYAVVSSWLGGSTCPVPVADWLSPICCRVHRATGKGVSTNRMSSFSGSVRDRVGYCSWVKETLPFAALLTCPTGKAVLLLQLLRNQAPSVQLESFVKDF
jgi:hypothetical protein